MKKLELDKVEEATETKRIISGGYIAKITTIEDVEEKEYLKIEYDIAEGEFKNYYANLSKNMGFWGGRFIRSYKETALSFFKGFVSAVEKSNKGYKFNEENEKSLVGKLVGIVLSEEEYVKSSGEKGKRLYVSDIRSTEKIKSNEFEVRELKRLDGSQAPAQKKAAELEPVDDDSLPF